LSVARNRLDSRVRSERLEDLEMMRLLDERYLEKPSHGLLPMQDYLLDKGYKVNEKKVRRLMRKMGLMLFICPYRATLPLPVLIRYGL
jgi:putative transposase